MFRIYGWQNTDWFSLSFLYVLDMIQLAGDYLERYLGVLYLAFPFLLIVPFTVRAFKFIVILLPNYYFLSCQGSL